MLSAAKLWRVLACLVGQLLTLVGGVVAEVGIGSALLMHLCLWQQHAAQP